MQDEKHRNTSRTLSILESWICWHNEKSSDWFQSSQCVPLIIQRVGFPLHLIVCKCWPPSKWPFLPSIPSLAVKNCHFPALDLVILEHQSAKYLQNGWVEKGMFLLGGGGLIIWPSAEATAGCLSEPLWIHKRFVNYRLLTVWKWGINLNENKYMCMCVYKFSCETRILKT